MYTILTILILIIAVLLIFVVTIQESKGGGLAAGFSSTNSIMGVQRTTNVVEKITWGLAAALAILCILSTRFAPTASITHGSEGESVIKDYVKQAPSAMPVEAQPFGEMPAPVAEEATPSTQEATSVAKEDVAPVAEGATATTPEAPVSDQ